jgi:hypothetical protein
MWFLFGLLCLGCGAVWLAVQRWEVDWRGDAFGHGRYKLHTYKGSVKWLRIGLATPSELDFELKPETWIDGLAKNFGISEEAQLGRADFDSAVYVISDDVRLIALLRYKPELLACIERIVNARPENFVFQRLVCRRGQLWLQLKPESAPSGHMATVQWALAELEELSKELPALAPNARRPLDRKFLHTVMVLGASGGLAVNALLQMLRLGFTHFPFTVDDGQLWSLTLPLTAALMAALVFATLFLLGRSARMHLVLGEVLLIGGIGALGTAFTELRDLNMEADSGPASVLDSRVLNKHSYRRRKGGRSYYVELANWNGGYKDESIQVSYTDYNRFSVGDNVRVRQHPGFFHVRWVESIEK